MKLWFGGNSAIRSALTAWAIGCLPFSASGALIASFETGLEGWFATAGVATTTTSAFGATGGTQALLIDNLTPGTKQYPARTPQFNAATAEFTAVYPIFSQAGSAMAAGLHPTLQFDLTFDFSNVTANGFFQISPLFNSNTVGSVGGFRQYGTGAFVTGNTNSPLGLGVAATNDGVTMTTLGPNQYRFEIPTGIGKSLSLSPASTFYTLAFQTNGGWQGTVDVAIDNIQFNNIPEPSALVLTFASLAGIAIVRRRFQA
ncbi:MAG: PEP-CTERM sorting domain-containing protein [Pirellulales bacterium]|nr:PEP-CTERM sorting domain-containing protein [Pirellulales bacterium]